MIVPCGRGGSRHGATVVFWALACPSEVTGAGLPVSGPGSAGPGGSIRADHVLEGGGETQPAHKRIVGLAGQQAPARRIGAS